MKKRSLTVKYISELIRQHCRFPQSRNNPWTQNTELYFVTAKQKRGVSSVSKNVLSLHGTVFRLLGLQSAVCMVNHWLSCGYVLCKTFIWHIIFSSSSFFLFKLCFYPPYPLVGRIWGKGSSLTRLLCFHLYVATLLFRANNEVFELLFF